MKNKQTNLNDNAHRSGIVFAVQVSTILNDNSSLNSFLVNLKNMIIIPIYNEILSYFFIILLWSLKVCYTQQEFL